MVARSPPPGVSVSAAWRGQSHQPGVEGPLRPQSTRPGPGPPVGPERWAHIKSAAPGGGIGRLQLQHCPGLVRPQLRQGAPWASPCSSKLDPMAPSKSTGPRATRASNSCFVTVLSSCCFSNSIAPSHQKYKVLHKTSQSNHVSVFPCGPDGSVRFVSWRLRGMGQCRQLKAAALRRAGGGAPFCWRVQEAAPLHRTPSQVRTSVFSPCPLCMDIWNENFLAFLNIPDTMAL